jgi:hypothetical protein
MAEGLEVRRASHIRWATAPAHVADPTLATPGRRIAEPPRRWDSLGVPSLPQPLLATTTFMYVESDVPEGMSLDAWRRRGNVARSRPSRLARLWRAVAG